MRKIFIAALALLLTGAAFAQNDTTTTGKKKAITPADLPRPSDHLMLQVGYHTWQNAPDSINTGGFPRTFNAYFFFAFPFKTNPHFSAAIGAGIATDNMYFDKMTVGIAERTPSLVFDNVADTNHFKKYKLATAWAEAPVELRFSSNPTQDKNSVKFAIGAKVGTLLGAHTKGKTLQDKNGNTINDFKRKDFGKSYFNTTRLSLTGRIGYGHFSAFAAYQVTPLFKEGQAPTIRPLTIGIALSGL